MDFLPATPPYEDDMKTTYIRKSIPHRSPTISSSTDNSLIFQLSHDPDLCKVIYGQSLISNLRKRVSNARLYRLLPYQHRSPNIIQLPNRQNSYTPPSSPIIPSQQSLSAIHCVSSVGRPSKVKGPCQACHVASDGCMRKAYHWPFPSSQVFYDKGNPYVYLCNKCGLRYNKSGGSVCRHCRWVFCKEEKRKALQYIDAMRDKYGHVAPDQDIENFGCHPKYWACNKPWKVGWVIKE